MTFREAMKKLSDAGIESARYEASLLCQSLCSIEPSMIPLLYDRELDCDEFDLAIERRAQREPLQYILGEWEFFGIPFNVNKNCLCPRPDTEITVEKALELLPKGGRFLELCTGSGCISVSLCKSRDDLSGIATDKFDDTADVARRNVERHGLSYRLSIVTADLFDSPDYIENEKFDALISNPPYIPTRDVESLSDEVKKEPIAALDGGEDGLDFYRYIVSEYPRYLKPRGVIIFEIGYNQADALKNIASKSGYSCEIYKDFEGNDRVAVIRT